MDGENVMPKKKTHEEFIKEIKEKYGNEYEILGEYKGNRVKISVKHKCGYEYEVRPYNILTGYGCPKCGKEVNKINNEDFQRMFKEKYGDEFTLLDEYRSSRDKMRIRHNCNYCGNHIRIMRADSILKELKCRVCEELEYNEKTFKEKLSKKENGNYKLLSKYKNKNTKVLVKHNCGYSWNVEPSVILSDRRCPRCVGNIKKTTEDYILEIRNIYGDEYKILGDYVNNHTKILMKHNKCGHEWEIRPSSLLRGNGCPVCANQTIILGINTIWDTDKWMVDLGVSEEDAKKYTHSSSKTIMVRCPDCGRERKTRISDIYTYKSIRCSCGDGKSYPEKFVISLLEQLGLEFETEYSPEWIKPKKYDFHLKNIDCIIETHGRQHYKENTFKYCGGRTLKEEQLNDNLKRNMALSNGIKYYIELDCSESNLEYIKNSILNSELKELFDLSNINWVSCAEFANKNIVKEVCNYWNNRGEDKTTIDLKEAFKLTRTTIIRYLKKGTKLGWCEYNPKEESFKGSNKSGKTNGKKVEIFKNGKGLGIFESCAELERRSEELFGVKLLANAISEVCNNKKSKYKGFTFKYID